MFRVTASVLIVEANALPQYPRALAQQTPSYCIQVMSEATAGDNGRLRGHAALLTGPPLKHVCGVNLDRFTYDALQSPVGRRPLSKLNSIH